MGGVPNVIQWMRLKPMTILAVTPGFERVNASQPVKMLSSELANSASMWAYNKLATAPPAGGLLIAKSMYCVKGFLQGVIEDVQLPV